jgi:uncharacterized membrane protein YcaP (DUF421 family)
MGSDVTPFDWHRIFIGDLTYGYVFEIAFRVVFLYIYTMIAFRLLGKRALGHLSPFETVLVVALGTGLGDPIFLPDVPLTVGIVVITTFLLCSRLFAWAKARFPQFEALVESPSTEVVRDGQLSVGNLLRNRIAVDEVYMLLRDKGIENLGQVRVAYLETSGHLSIYADDERQGFGLPLVPPVEEVPRVSNAHHGNFACATCGTLQTSSDQPCPRCRKREWVWAKPFGGRSDQAQGE